MTGWREVARVAAFLTEHRASLRPLAEVRCPVPPSPVLAQVHMVEGARWVWGVGDKPTPAQLHADGIDIEADGWLKVAPAVRPLDEGWPIAGKAIHTCRKCRRSYGVDLAELDRVTASLPRETVKLLATHRVVSRAD